MAELNPKPQLTEEMKGARDRRLYLKVRLPAVRGEMKDLRAENSSLAEKLKSASSAGKATADSKTVRERRIYVTQRLKALKDELAALQQEHKELGKTRA